MSFEIKQLYFFNIFIMEIGFAIAMALMAVVAVIWAKNCNDKARRLEVENARLTAELDAANRLVGEVRDAERRQAEALSERLLGENAARASEDTARRVKIYTDVLEQRIEDFRRVVDDGFARSKASESTVQETMRQIMECSRGVDRRTNELASALRGDNRAQGDWGEVILENILEGAGLRNGREFFTQQTVSEGGKRPDVTVVLPDERWVVIDSKNSVTAYLNWLSAKSDGERAEALQAHRTSVKKHVEELRRKDYQGLTPAGLSGSRRPDFVIMFMPYEGAFMAAIQADPRLWETAYAAGVIIATPTHLMALLKIIEQLWRGETQQANARKISEEATKLMEKITGFLIDVDKVGTSIKAAQTAYEAAMKKATEDRDSVLHRIKKFEDMGIRTKKTLPQSMSPDAAEE